MQHLKNINPCRLALRDVAASTQPRGHTINIGFWQTQPVFIKTVGRSALKPSSLYKLIIHYLDRTRWQWARVNKWLVKIAEHWARQEIILFLRTWQMKLGWKWQKVFSLYLTDNETEDSSTISTQCSSFLEEFRGIQGHSGQWGRTIQNLARIRSCALSNASCRTKISSSVSINSCWNLFPFLVFACLHNVHLFTSTDVRRLSDSQWLTVTSNLPSRCSSALRAYYNECPQHLTVTFNFN